MRFALLGAMCVAGAAFADVTPRSAATPVVVDSTRQVAPSQSTVDTISLLTPERIAKYASGSHLLWMAYLQRSAALHATDTTAMLAELRAGGMPATTRAPSSAGFVMTPSMSAAWLASDSARRIADIIVSFQAPNGGWASHIDVTAHLRQPGESYSSEDGTQEWISTLDNGATTEEMRFLGSIDGVRFDARYEQAFMRGLGYLLTAQFPNGCFPQVYPLAGSYHDAATFNDDGAMHALTLLRDVANGQFRFVPEAMRASARSAGVNGMACIVAAQITDRTRLTGWAQYHDPLTLEPTTGRSFELKGIAALETAGIVDYIMGEPKPSSQIVRVVRAAAAWLQSVPVDDYSYSNFVLRRDANGGPLWGRVYELDTWRVIMANRDGKTLTDWNRLTDGRTGYEWYTTRPATTLGVFSRWSLAHPR